MRIYLSPILSKIFSTAVLLLSLGLVVFLTQEAIKTWSNDPALNQIPEVMQRTQ